MPTPKPIRERLFGDFESAYIEAAYFTEGGPDHPDFEDAELSDSARAKIRETCACFFDKVYDEFIGGAADAKQFGHDFWLSRNGHGAGFFDRDSLEREVRDKLQELARSFGEHNLYVGDDGLIYSLQQ